VEAVFRNEEVELIKSIPISSTNQLDAQIWFGTEKGDFTVKSASHLHREMVDWGKAECSSKSGSSEVLKTIWKMKTPNAIKVFLWQACHNLLPIQENLFKKKIISDPLCPICGTKIELTYHVLWRCPSTMDIWGGGGRIFQKCRFSRLEFLQVVKGFLNKCKEEEFVLFVGLDVMSISMMKASFT
jgi:hypothetical protein